MLTNIVKDAFDTFKAKFISALLLIHFNSDKWICIESDASDAAVTIIILQLMNDEL